MKLCWLIPNDKGGGVISVALSCCRQAAAAGHDVTLLMLTEPTGHVEEYTTFRCASLQLSEHSSRAPGALVEWLRQHPQDVLLINDTKPAYPALPHIPMDTRTAFVVHDTGRTYWQPVIQHMEVLDAVIAVSNVVQAQYSHRLGGNLSCHVVHNGTLFPKDVDPLSSRERIDDLVFLGGSKPFKGAADVCAFWPLLVRRGFRGVLHWYGAISDSYQRKIRNLPQQNRIIVHGRVPRSDIFRRVARSKVLLVPSRVEPFGMVTIEGMGMGAVPVAWDIPTGTREIVTPGETGLLSPLGDYPHMANNVMYALEHHVSMAPRAMAVARHIFSEEAMWERYKAVLQAIQQRPPRPRPKASEPPPTYTPETRYFQLLPEVCRNAIRGVLARSPTLSYWVRNLRGL